MKKKAFDFKNWVLNATENSIRLLNSYRQLNEENQQNALYNKNATQLAQTSQILSEALTALKQGTDIANLLLAAGEKATIAVIKMVEEFQQINGQIINQLRDVHLDQNQLEKLTNRYKIQEPAATGANKVLALEEQFAMEAIGALYAIPDQIEGINYKIKVIGYNIDDLKNGYHFDYFGVLIPDSFFIDNYQINLNDMVKYPFDKIIDNQRDSLAAGEPSNDFASFVRKTAQDGQNALEEMKASFQSQTDSITDQTGQDLMGEVNNSAEATAFKVPSSL